MGFWIFMLATVFLIPITMIYFGQRFMKKAPDNINFVFGYRTARSMQNKDTWSFSHKYIGRLWYYTGLIVLPLSVVSMLFVFGKAADTVGTTGGIITAVQMLFLAGAIVSTENALKKNFDVFGKRR